jgi:hypothetical protein
MLFVRGVGEHTIELLAHAQVHSVEQLHQTTEETLLRETGLGLRKVRQVKAGAATFLTSEQKVIDEARRAAREAAAQAAAQAAAEAATTPDAADSGAAQN